MVFLTWYCSEMLHTRGSSFDQHHFCIFLYFIAVSTIVHISFHIAVLL